MSKSTQATLMWRYMSDPPGSSTELEMTTDRIWLWMRSKRHSMRFAHIRMRYEEGPMKGIVREL